MITFNKNLLVILTSLLITGLVASASAENTVRIAIPDDYVTKYPQQSGLVGPFAVVQQVYVRAGYQLKVVVRPAQRVGQSTLHHEADVFIDGATDSVVQTNKLLKSNLPIIIIPVLAYYRRSENWQPSWPPDQHFKSLIGKSVQAARHFRDLHGLNVSLSPSFAIAAKMVEIGRADYFIDNLGGFIELSDSVNHQPKPLFTFKTLFSEALHLFVRNDKPGAKLMNEWNNGQLRLLKQKKYQAIYNQANDVPLRWPLVEQLINTLQQQHPELNIPSQ